MLKVYLIVLGRRNPIGVICCIVVELWHQLKELHHSQAVWDWFNDCSSWCNWTIWVVCRYCAPWDATKGAADRTRGLTAKIEVPPESVREDFVERPLWNESSYHLRYGHTTASSVADWMIHFARAVVLEVTLAFSRLSEDLILRAQGHGGLGVRKHRRRSPFPSLFGSTVAGGVASQSNYSLPKVSSFLATAAKVDTVWLGWSEASVVGNLSQGTQLVQAVILKLERKICLWLSWSLQTKGSKKIDLNQSSSDGSPNSIPPSN